MIISKFANSMIHEKVLNKNGRLSLPNEYSDCTTHNEANSLLGDTNRDTHKIFLSHDNEKDLVIKS